MACFGGEEKVKIRHNEACDTCRGDGVKPAHSDGDAVAAAAEDAAHGTAA